MDIKVIESSGNNEWDSALKKINAITYAGLDAMNSKESNPVNLKFLAVNKVVGFTAGLISPIRNSSRKQLFFYLGPVFTDKETALFNEFRKSLLDYAKAKGFQRLTMHSYDVSFCFQTSLKKIITGDRPKYFYDLYVDYQWFVIQIERETRRRIRKAKKNENCLLLRCTKKGKPSKPTPDFPCACNNRISNSAKFLRASKCSSQTCIKFIG